MRIFSLFSVFLFLSLFSWAEENQASELAKFADGTFHKNSEIVALNYGACDTTPNYVGPGAILQFQGDNVPGVRQFSITGLPPAQNNAGATIILLGSAYPPIPFGQGNLCINIWNGGYYGRSGVFFPDSMGNISGEIEVPAVEGSLFAQGMYRTEFDDSVLDQYQRFDFTNSVEVLSVSP